MFIWVIKLCGCVLMNWFVFRVLVGKVIFIWVLWFNLLLILIDLFMSLIRCFDIFKFKLVLFIWWVFFICLKGVKSCFWLLLFILMFWLMILNIILLFLYFICVFIDLLWLVNLIVFDSKLSVIWLNLVLLKNNELGIVLLILVLNMILLFLVWILVSENKWVKKFLVFIVCGIICIFFVFICFIFKIEFIIFKSFLLFWFIWESGVVNDEGKFNFWVLFLSNWLNVFMVLSGVLILWFM